MKQKIICIYAQDLLLLQSEFPLMKFKTDTAFFNFCKIYAHEKQVIHFYHIYFNFSRVANATLKRVGHVHLRNKISKT